MPEQPSRRLFVVEAARQRVVVSARDAGWARTIAAVMLLDGAPAADRDALRVREPEDEEWAAFVVRAREFEAAGGCRLAAMPL
ncbi:hypothetical protein [Azospirillum sp. sgz302134]